MQVWNLLHAARCYLLDMCWWQSLGQLSFTVSSWADTCHNYGYTGKWRAECKLCCMCLTQCSLSRTRQAGRRCCPVAESCLNTVHCGMKNNHFMNYSDWLEQYLTYRDVRGQKNAGPAQPQPKLGLALPALKPTTVHPGPTQPMT